MSLCVIPSLTRIRYVVITEHISSHSVVADHLDLVVSIGGWGEVQIVICAFPAIIVISNLSHMSNLMGHRKITKNST